MLDHPPSAARSPRPTKRKRSIIACAACNRRKVRCDVATSGTPCHNCHQDGVQCEIYRRKIGIPGHGRSKTTKIRQDSTSSENDNHLGVRSYLLTPSPTAASMTGLRPQSESNIVDGGVISRSIADTNSEAAAAPDQRFDRGKINQDHPRLQSEKAISELGKSLASGGARLGVAVEPFFAGESEGLEFLFDQCAPDRPVKGVHYVTPGKTYRHRRTYPSKNLGPQATLPALPTPQLQRELVRCFFQNVYPVLPVIDVKDFLETFESDPSKVSPLLLWSIFFASLNFIDKETLRSNRLPPRKILKEQYYQNAKDLYDSQIEPSKTVLMSACLMLATYYIDLEDRDGSCYWIGIAISLCHTIGLQRASNYGSMPSGCPFPIKTRNLWRRIWWSVFYRDAWLAQGFGRPMRLSIEDCDEAFSTADEVLEELRELPAHLIEKWLPLGIAELMDSWAVMVRLSVELAEILRCSYRPRSPVPSPSFVRDRENRLVELRSQIPATSFSTPDIVLIHICHLEMYFNATLIILYRPLMGKTAERITNSEHIACRQECVGKIKMTAYDTTNILNKLMSLNALDRSPSMIVSAIMSAMQIIVFDMRTAKDTLAKGYATHQLDLHLLVLGHLRKTYWTADLQHNLFIEVLKVLNGDKECEHSGNVSKTPANERVSSPEREEVNKQQAQSSGDDPSGELLFEGESGLGPQTSLDEYFFGVFNPFMGLPGYADDLSNSVDWDLSPATSLTLPGMSDRLEDG